MKNKLGHILVECPICHKILSGRVPKGGDGTCLFPFKHISALDGYTNPCPGSYELIELPYRTPIVRNRSTDIRRDDL